METLVKINKNNYVDKYEKYKNIGLVKHTEKIIYETKSAESLNQISISESQSQFVLISALFISIIGSLIGILGVSSIVSNSILILFLCILISVFKSLKSLN